jgi:RecB family exonuclease
VVGAQDQLLRRAQAEQRLSSRGIFDRAHALSLARARLARGELPRLLAMVQSLEVIDPIDAEPLEIDLLIGIARAGLPVRVVLPLDDADRGLCAGVDAVLRRFEQAHDVATLDVALVPVGAGDAHGSAPVALVPALFLPDARAPHAEARALACADRSDEARVVAGMVARLLADDPDARVAVALRTVDGGERRVADALAAHGVATRNVRQSLAETAAGRLVHDVLATVIEGAPRDRLLAVMTSPCNAQALALDDASQVLRVLRRAAARTDLEDSGMRRDGYQHRLVRLAQALDARDDISVQDVERVLDLIKRQLALLRPLAEATNMAAQLEALAAILSAILDDGVSLFGAETLDVVRQLAAAARRDAGVAPVTLRATAQLVQHAMSRFRAVERVNHDNAVMLLSVPELWGRRFDHVVLIGAEEGRFPLPERRASLLSDLDRIAVNRVLGRRALSVAEIDPMAEVAGSLALEPLWLVGAIEAAERSFCITHARRDDRGRELSPSSFFLEVERALGPRSAPRLLATPRAQVVAVASARARGELSDADAVSIGVPPTLLAHIDRSVKVTRERLRFFSGRGRRPLAELRAPYAFAVQPERMRRVFAPWLGLSASRPLTPTRLEALAACRMHGFVQHVLKVDVDEPAGNAADARVLGTLAHAVLEQFFLERKAARVPVSRFAPADRVRLLEVIQAHTAPLLAGRATGHLAAIRAQVGWLETALVRAVSMLSRDPKIAGVEPQEMELHIGVSIAGQPPQLGPVPMLVKNADEPASDGARTLWFGGIIDRVDEGNGGRAVIDYKTAGTGAIRYKVKHDALFETHFQLLLYLRLLEHHRPTAAQVPLHGYLISLRDGTTSDDIGRVDNLRARITDDSRPDSLAAAIGRVMLPIIDGTLPPDVHDRCEDCRLQRLCRVPQLAELAPDLDDVEEADGP